MTILDYIRCPHCGGTLTRVDKSLLCAARHTFDVAKAGYVNLLPPGKEKNARTGDEKAMVAARRDFLSRDYYAPISDTVAALADKYLAPGATALADMGCGEGYHTCRIVAGLASRGRAVTALGFDASKYAAECATKRARAAGYLPQDGVGAPSDSDVQAAFFPANLFHLPVAAHTLDLTVSMFAPIAAEETARILKPGGLLCVVASGREHLRQLRETIYDEVHFSEDTPAVPAGFREVARHRLTDSVTLPDRAAIASLFVMTPFYYKTTEEGRARLEALHTLTTTVDVEYALFEVM